MNTELRNYLEDGANPQAQAVLALLKGYHEEIVDDTWNDKYHSYDATILVGRYENCREQGYIFTLRYNFNQLLHIAVYEHRNSDRLCVKTFNGTFINTPRAEDVFKPTEGKYDYDKSFKYGAILECTEWIVKIFKNKINEQLENK